MVLQEDELQEIVNTVLSAVRTNSRTIDQLTPTSTPLNGDCIELSGGRKIAYLTLESHIAQAVNHKSIPVEELDNMGYSDADAFFKAMLEPHHTRYTVTSGHLGAVRNVGLLEMFSTPGYCTITQIFVTNLILRDGGVFYSDIRTGTRMFMSGISIFRHQGRGLPRSHVGNGRHGMIFSRQTK